MYLNVASLAAIVLRYDHDQFHLLPNKFVSLLHLFSICTARFVDSFPRGRLPIHDLHLTRARVAPRRDMRPDSTSANIKILPCVM